jgi:hypothetical protein
MQTDGDTGWRWVEGSTQTRKEHNLNQQQALDQDTNSTRRNLKRIMQKAKRGFWDKGKT